MQKRFIAIREDTPGNDWLARFVAGRAEAEAWYRGTGREAPPTAAECTAQLRRHMPELLSPYEQACALVGADDDLAHRIISQYRPPPLAPGCTQAVWLGDDGPALVRNYDFLPDVVSGHFESTRWFGQEVISKGQRPWGGCLDGMNAAGLVASVTFGGEAAQGAGFSIILIVRYLLETCSKVSEAIAALCRIPVAMAQNVTLLDQAGSHATVFLNPERAPFVSRTPACANHQEPRASTGLPARAASSLDRQQTALRSLEGSGATLAKVIEAFMAAPIYSRDPSSPTVYGAVYRPADLSVDYLWPGHVMRQRIGSFRPGQYVHDYGAATTRVS
jgi:predicted choloylglycine hydrolase